MPPADCGFSFRKIRAKDPAGGPVRRLKIAAALRPAAAQWGARVTLTGVETGVRLSTGSNDAGVYRFDAIDLGVYEPQVAHPGFRRYRGAGITTPAGRFLNHDFTDSGIRKFFFQRRPNTC
jgi:hypothetical protein